MTGRFETAPRRLVFPDRPSPMARAQGALRGRDLDALPVADVARLVDIPMGREASLCFRGIDAHLSNQLVALAAAEEALALLRGALTGIASDMAALRDGGRVDAAVARIRDCADACGDPDLGAQSFSLKVKFVHLASMMRDEPDGSVRIAVRPRLRGLQTRLAAVTALVRHHRGMVLHASLLTRTQAAALRDAAPSRRAGLLSDIQAGLGPLEAEWRRAQAEVRETLRDALVDRGASGADALSRELEELERLLDSRDGIGTAVARLRAACGERRTERSGGETRPCRKGRFG